MFDFSNYSSKSKDYDNSSKLVVGKMKDETGAVAVKEFVVLMPKTCSFLVDDNIEHKKAKGVNENVVEKINHREYKDILLSQKCVRHSINSV